MKKGLMGAVAAAALMLGTGQAFALGAFDFTTLTGNAPGSPGDEGVLADTVTVNGITAKGFKYTSPTTYDAKPLWLRNVTNDHGLGVCSEGTSNCTSGAGDVNEISALTNFEVLQLTLPDGEKWTSLWVSSLDNNSGNTQQGVENGTAFFSNDDTGAFNLSTATGIGFTYGDFGTNVEGDLFTLSAFTSDASLMTKKYIYFIAGTYANGTGTGNNNDYLVWKGATAAVPIPAALPMLFAALGGLGFAGWRSNRRPA